MNRTADALRHDAPRTDTPRSESWPEATPGTDAPPSPAFPGCRSFRLTRDAVDHHDGRFEYWDAATETAWVVAEPTSGTHEQPSRRLSALGEVIASLRGGAIECRGSMDLIWNAGQRERRRILQADEVVYLHPARARIPGKTGLVLGEHDLPDVVLEVDHTTDVRRGKLGLYAAWGFPEVWVEVPDVTSPSRPAGRVPGLTIHRLDAGSYRTLAASIAFPGWTAAEIHVALNEPVRSDATDRALERVAGTLGTRDGTGPEDTPWLRRQRAEGRRAERDAVLRAILNGRGMAALEPVLAEREAARLPLPVALDAVQHCRDAADLRARLARSDGGGPA
ncbi:MAG: Uma2 family endonuclease [Acidobacteria bacterium]|nr:Uma2 family endonuclease [Acidobacteriota bacterium]